MPYELTAKRRLEYRATSLRSMRRKAALLQAARTDAVCDFKPALDPIKLMPQRPPGGLVGLSLFSGGGGLDLGFERAGIEHGSSFEVLEICGETLKKNRQAWTVNAGNEGDVRRVSWRQYRGVDVVHGGPPCQPFSIAGDQRGASDDRNLWPEFVRCVIETRPRAFVAENVPGLLDRKFARFVEHTIVRPLAAYELHRFMLSAADFGVPQTRKRLFIVGFKKPADSRRFEIPRPTHGPLSAKRMPFNMARASLGYPDIGFDALAPTLRSGFTGPRKTTGVLNSKASLATWSKLQIWPNGVQLTPSLARAYPPENGHLRLSVRDCAILQGFPLSWTFEGAVYQALGQIGNSVAPPVAYAVANAIADALGAG